MKHGAYIPLSGKPFPHDPLTFSRLNTWQRAAALEVVYRYVKEGKVLGPFPGDTRTCPVTGRPLFFYPFFCGTEIQTRSIQVDSKRLIQPGWAEC